MRISRAVQFALRYVAIDWALFFALRSAFFLTFGGAAKRVEGGDLAQAFWIGARFDLKFALLLAILPALAATVPALDLARRPGLRRAYVAWIAVTGAITFLLYTADFAHFAWVQERLNATALEHLENPAIALQTIWESYPVVPLLAVLALSVFGYVRLLDRHAVGVLAGPIEPVPRWRLAGAVTGSLVLLVVGYRGTVGRYPLSWSDAYFSGDPFVAAAGLQPVLHVWETLTDRERPFDEEATRAAYARMAEFLHVDEPDPQSLSFARHVAATKPEGARPNVVIVVMESFAALRVGRFGFAPELDPTPHFDALSRESVFFSHFFVPRPPTARAIFSTLFSLPDVNPPHSASRSPTLVRQETILNAFEGYQKLYMLGGSASFANIRGMLAANVPDLRLLEEGYYPLPSDDVWGINDLALLEQANLAFRDVHATGKPFVAVVQLSGNHRPYLIPENHGEFTLATADPKTLERNGFATLDAYNAIRFMDYAVGNFFDLARKEPYFPDTVFILYGDHGTSTTLDVPYRADGLLSGHHIPAVIYAPELAKRDARLAPRTIGHVVSMIDVLPTAAELAGVSYETSALGRSMLAERPADEHVVYLSRTDGDGVAADGWLLQCDRKTGRRILYLYDDPVRPTVDVSAEFPEQLARLDELLVGFRETSRWLLHRNAQSARKALVAGSR